MALTHKKNTPSKILWHFPEAYCIKLLPEKNSGYFNQRFLAMVKSVVISAYQSFQILPEFFAIGPWYTISYFSETFKSEPTQLLQQI